MAFQYVDYPQKMKDLLMQIFDDSFMQANTRFQSFEGFRYSSAVFVNWNSALCPDCVKRSRLCAVQDHHGGLSRF